MLALAARGWELRGLVSDTALAAYLVRPDQRSYDLADLTLRYLKRELRTHVADDGQGELTFDTDEGATGAQDVAMLHARAVLDLAEALDDGDRGARRRPAARPRWSCRWSTCWPRWSRSASRSTSTTSRRWSRHFAAEVKQAAEDAFAVIGKEINLGSPKQLQVVLFDELDMPKTKRTKTG